MVVVCVLKMHNSSNKFFFSNRPRIILTNSKFACGSVFHFLRSRLHIIYFGIYIIIIYTIEWARDYIKYDVKKNTTQYYTVDSIIILLCFHRCVIDINHGIRFDFDIVPQKNWLGILLFFSFHYTTNIQKARTHRCTFRYNFLYPWVY